MQRLRTIWIRLRDNLWFVPSVLTVAGGLLAVLMLRLDQIHDFQGPTTALIFQGGVEGARGVLSVIAGSILTVAGVAFSVTIVALQLASSQYTPRVLRSFTGDHANQVVLGIFIATFTYTLLVLRTVRGAESPGEFVPAASVTGALVLSLVSIGALIYFINHLARSMLAATILDRVSHDIHGIVDHVFPDDVGDPASDAGLPADAHEVPDGPGLEVTASRSGYLQTIDAESLFQLAEKGRWTLRMEHQIGDFIMEGEVLALAWGSNGSEDEVVESVRSAFNLGAERTPDQDVERGLIEIVDIVVKALSPGINDPTTAMMGIDRLGESLALLGRRQLPERSRVGDGGKVLFIARIDPWERVVEVAFGQIRMFAASNPTVVIRMLMVLDQVAALIVPPRWPAIGAQARLLLGAAQETLPAQEWRRVEAALPRVRRSLQLAMEHADA